MFYKVDIVVFKRTPGCLKDFSPYCEKEPTLIIVYRCQKIRERLVNWYNKTPQKTFLLRTAAGDFA